MSFLNLCAQFISNNTKGNSTIVLGDASLTELESTRFSNTVDIVQEVGANQAHQVFLRVIKSSDLKLFIDDRRSDFTDASELFMNVFFGIQQDGLYCISPSALNLPSTRKLLELLLASASNYLRGETHLRSLPPKQGELARAIGKLEFTDSGLVISKRNQHFSKLRELDFHEQVPEAFSVTVLAETESSTVVPSGSTLSITQDDRTVRFENHINAPRLQARLYNEVTVAPGQIVRSNSFLLPDSFRHWNSKNLNNRHYFNSSYHYQRPRHSEHYPDWLPGTYYHLDSEYSGQYGHLLTEQISRMWYLKEALEKWPDLMILASPGTSDGTMERRMLEAFGVPGTKLRLIDRPAVVESLIVATPSFENPHYFHPIGARVWDEIGDALESSKTLHSPDLPDKVFIDRAQEGNRVCRNGNDVVSSFVERGFTIIRPEEFDLPNQVALFRGASVVAGYGGSGMINLIWTRGGKKTVLISHPSYGARNEHLINMVRGNDELYLSGIEETQHPVNGWSPQAFVSPFSIDIERFADQIDSFLDSRNG